MGFEDASACYARHVHSRTCMAQVRHDIRSTPLPAEQTQELLEAFRMLAESLPSRKDKIEVVPIALPLKVLEFSLLTLWSCAMKALYSRFT